MVFQNILNRLYKSSIDIFINYKSHLKELFIAIAIALLFRNLLFTIYRIPTESMIPTFKVEDTLLANRFGYGLKIPFTDGLNNYRLSIPGLSKIPESGDVIIFRGSPEKFFYHVVTSPRNNEAINIVSNINNDSAKYRKNRPLSVNYQASKTNYIFDFDGRFMVLYPEIYEKYKTFLLDENLFLTKDFSYGSRTMTYFDHEYIGLAKSILSGPITVLSILGEAIINSPLCWWIRIIIVTLAYSSDDVYSDSLINQLVKNGQVSFYPNKYTDQTKDLVKRIVAEEGDTVVIRNNILYVNDKERVMKYDSFLSESDNQYPYYNTYTITYTNKNGKQVIHPVRFLKDNKAPHIVHGDFDPSLWPYDPNSFYADKYKHNFGPIVVPKNHYFVMGDNRDESLDSRFFGCVPNWAIKGKPLFIFYPRMKKVK